MKTDTKIMIGAVIVSLTIIISGIFLLGNDKSPQRDKLGTASATIDKKFADLGTMKSDEERSANFIITNPGNQTLRIWNIATSCDCTFASITIDGQETGEFNMPMHMNGTLKNWIGEIAPKKMATLKVIYRPKVMPVTGPVSRSVTFATNDPKNENVEVTIQANVL